MTLPRIYCDMDGVLADFKTPAVRLTGMPIEKWKNLPKSKEKWAPIVADKNLWSTLPWQRGGQQLWRYIKKYTPHILSAYVPNNWDPNCIPGKKKWLRDKVGLSGTRVNLVTRPEKSNYAKLRSGPAILIDDYIRNVKNFNNAGGIGIYHTDTNKTIAQLKRLGFE